jgi:hypothetical protein
MNQRWVLMTLGAAAALGVSMVTSEANVLQREVERTLVHGPGRRDSTPRRDGAHAPIAVAWRIQEAPSRDASRSTTVALLAEVTRRWNIAVPIEVRLELPKEVTLLSGARRFELAPGPAGKTSQRALRLRYETPPRNALRLWAEVRSTTFGARMYADHFFGEKPEPPLAKPDFGSDFIVGRWNLGPSLRMGDPKTR